MLFSPIKTMEVNCMNPVVTEVQGCPTEIFHERENITHMNPGDKVTETDIDVAIERENITRMNPVVTEVQNCSCLQNYNHNEHHTFY
jgi:hypothetical protein